LLRHLKRTRSIKTIDKRTLKSIDKRICLCTTLDVTISGRKTTGLIHRLILHDII